MDIPRNKLAVGFFELLTKRDNEVTAEEVEALFAIIGRNFGDGLFYSRIEIDTLNYIFSLKGENSVETGIKMIKKIIDNEKRKK